MQKGTTGLAAVVAPRSERKLAITILVVLTTSVTINIALGMKIRRLEAGLAERTPKLSPSIGSIVAPLRVQSMDGQQRILDFGAGNKNTLLYVLSPVCSWCKANLENIRVLADSLSDSHRIFGLALESEDLKLIESDHATRPPFPVFLLPASLSADLGLGSTPQTMLISPEGRVLKNWLGAYVGNQKKQIEAHFGVKLPGLVFPNIQTTRRDFVVPKKLPEDTKATGGKR